MKKYILKFGLISGAISAGLISIVTIFSSQIGYDNGVYFGYAAIILASVPIYFAILSYNNSKPDKKITYWQGVKVGLGVSVISSLCYVAVWLVLYYTVMPDFFINYGKHILDKMQASGATDAQILAKKAELLKMNDSMKNPLLNAAYTFTEPFPVEILITLISAAIVSLKKK